KIYLVQHTKKAERLGDSFRVPVEVMEFALGVLTARFEWLDLDPLLRLGGDGQPVRTDNGNLIVDLRMPPDPGVEPDNRNAMNPETLRAALNIMPGVVGHGLFLDEADEIIVEDESGGLSRLL